MDMRRKRPRPSMARRACTCALLQFQVISALAADWRNGQGCHLDSKYSHLRVQCGNVIPPLAVRQSPVISWISNEICAGGSCVSTDSYTVMMVDADSSGGPFLQWLVRDIPGNNITKGITVSKYLDPTPHKGCHREVLFLFRHLRPAKINAKLKLSRADFNVALYAKLHHLGSPLSSNMFHTGDCKQKAAAHQNIEGLRLRAPESKSARTYILQLASLLITMLCTFGIVSFIQKNQSRKVHDSTVSAVDSDEDEDGDKEYGDKDIDSDEESHQLQELQLSFSDEDIID